MGVFPYWSNVHYVYRRLKWSQILGADSPSIFGCRSTVTAFWGGLHLYSWCRRAVFPSLDDFVSFADFANCVNYGQIFSPPYPPALTWMLLSLSTEKQDIGRERHQEKAAFTYVSFFFVRRDENSYPDAKNW